MNDDAIDRALSNEPEISPSLGFSSRVMREVRHEAASRRAIPFPWKPVAIGLALTAALTLATALGGGAPSEATFATLPEHLMEAFATLASTLAGILVLTWWSLRFARR